MAEQRDPKVLEAEIREIISKIVEVAPEKITLDAKLVEDVGMDSMNVLEILAQVEKKLGIRIPEDNVRKATTLRHVLDIVNEVDKGI